MATHGWQRAREAFRSASHSLVFRAMPVLLSSLMVVGAACNSQNQGAGKMGDSESKNEAITQKKDNDSTKAKLKDVTPVKPEKEKIAPPKSVPPSELSKAVLDSMLKRQAERVRDKNLVR